LHTRRWLNRYQAQTLVLGNVLLYMEGVFNLVRGPLFVLIGFAMLLAGYGIANDKRIAWRLGVAASFLSVVMRVADANIGFEVFFSLVFPVALLTLLVHPHSRDYQKIWFS